MSFAFPLAFFALLLLLPLVFVLRQSARWTRHTAATFKGRPPGQSYFVARVVFACLFLIALITLGARPYIAYKKSANFVFIVDVSRSMHARHSCSEPTFLARAKLVLKETIAAIPEARVSIFAFDRFAFPITQFTTDRAYLFDVIEHGLYVGLVLESTQTEIANALQVVAAKRKRLPEIYGETSHVVLLSDGHVGGAYERRMQKPINELREAGVKVSTIGIGNPVETPIAFTDSGQCIGRHIEVNGDIVMIPLRADILKYIATESGGNYFSEKETARLIKTLRAELENQKVGDDATAGPLRDISVVFLALATIALLGLVYLPARPSAE